MLDGGTAVSCGTAADSAFIRAGHRERWNEDTVGHPICSFGEHQELPSSKQIHSCDSYGLIYYAGGKDTTLD